MSNPGTAEWGDRIYLRYRVLDSNGDLLEESDQTADGYELGNSDLPDPVQLRLLGAAPGTPISILISAKDEAFGPHDPMQIQRLPRSQFEGLDRGLSVDLKAGALVEFALPGENFVAGYVVDIDSEEVVVDFNHPLIGRDCVFELDVVDVVKAGHKPGSSG
ncbi:MAG: hypothetical protein VW546_08605 [Gammaproteobacteria bacterium]